MRLIAGESRVPATTRARVSRYARGRRINRHDGFSCSENPSRGCIRPPPCSIAHSCASRLLVGAYTVRGRATRCIFDDTHSVAGHRTAAVAPSPPLLPLRRDPTSLRELRLPRRRRRRRTQSQPRRRPFLPFTVVSVSLSPRAAPPLAHSLQHHPPRLVEPRAQFPPPRAAVIPDAAADASAAPSALAAARCPTRAPAAHRVRRRSPPRAAPPPPPQTRAQSPRPRCSISDPTRRSCASSASLARRR